MTIRLKIAALVLLCGIPVAAHASLATWTFYETSCTTSAGMSGDCDPAAPRALLALTLPAGGSATADVQIGLRRRTPRCSPATRSYSNFLMVRASFQPPPTSRDYRHYRRRLHGRTRCFAPPAYFPPSLSS